MELRHVVSQLGVLVFEIAAGAEEAERVLSERGREGWELVAVVPIAEEPAQMTMFLKRLAATDSLRDQVEDGEADTAESAQGAGVEGTEEAESPEPGFSVLLTGSRGEQGAVALALAQLCPWLHLKDAKPSSSRRQHSWPWALRKTRPECSALPLSKLERTSR